MKWKLLILLVAILYGLAAISTRLRLADPRENRAPKNRRAPQAAADAAEAVADAAEAVRQWKPVSIVGTIVGSNWTTDVLGQILLVRAHRQTSHPRVLRYIDHPSSGEAEVGKRTHGTRPACLRALSRQGAALPLLGGSDAPHARRCIPAIHAGHVAQSC